MQANKTADNQYLIPLMDGIIENIDIADGILLTTSEFVSKEDIEMTTTHDDLSLFQISFCIDGNMEWSYINNEVVHQFQIAAQQSQVRYGTFKECRSKISGNRRFKRISITLGHVSAKSKPSLRYDSADNKHETYVNDNEHIVNNTKSIPDMDDFTADARRSMAADIIWCRYIFIKPEIKIYCGNI